MKTVTANPAPRSRRAMPPPIRPRPRNAMRGVLMAGKFPDVNAERYNKRAKTAAENSAALEWKNGARLGGLVGRPTDVVCVPPVPY